VLPIFRNSCVGQTSPVLSEQFFETFLQRRSNTPAKLFRWRNRTAKCAQRVLDAFRDAFKRVGQCSIQIEE
jgi:hypothetical protein